MEFVLAFDNDDTESMAIVKSYCEKSGIHHTIHNMKRFGYKHLNHYLNHIWHSAKGSYLWFWNDDALMLTQNWDTLLLSEIQAYPDAVWDVENNHYPWILPLVPRKYIQAMGHFSLCANSDTWIDIVFARILGLGRKSQYLQVRHYRNESDQTEFDYKEAQNGMDACYQEQWLTLFEALRLVDANRVLRSHFPHVEPFKFEATKPNQIVGFVGMGKLGLPVAVGMANQGHIVCGYDIAPHINSTNHPKDVFHSKEAGFDGTGDIAPLLERTKLRFLDDLRDVVEVSNIIFVAVQTPHDPKFEGCTRLPKERQDFDYQYLCKSIEDIDRICASLQKETIVVIISTVLPGTLQKHIIPKLSGYVKLCYNPYFIAMGTVLKDFFQPEFVLFGCNDQAVIDTMKQFYATISPAPVFATTIETAELIKVCYNTMISTKIAFANTVMEMCDKIPNTNVDHVTHAMQLATNRICSGAYLKGGMGDGGGCHPRDNIAMSWLSNQLGLRYNLFDAIMTAREEQTEYLADLIDKYYKKYAYPVVILGKAFKPNTNMVTGSPSILLYNLLKERQLPCTMYDPHTDPDAEAPWGNTPTIFFVGTKHEEFMYCTYPSGSIIIDPHRYIQYQSNMATLHCVGDPIHSVNTLS